jgi:hypothetical protein
LEETTRRALLAIDAAVNVALGVLLLVFPKPVVRALGAPEALTGFYPSILGAVLIGIGLALMIEHGNQREGSRGLGLVGALTINLAGGATLAWWLIFGSLNLPVRGAMFLWALVVLLVGLSGVELGAELRRSGSTMRPD